MQEGKLSDREQLILRTVTESVRGGEKLTAGGIAAHCGVSASSVIKLAQKLGYRGLREMQYRLEAEEEETLRPPSGSLCDLLGPQAKAYIDILAEMLHDYRSCRNIVMGLGFCEHAAEYFRQCLWERDIIAISVVSQSLHIRSGSGLSTAGRSPGILFVFNESGVVPLQVSVEAREGGYNVVSFTASRESPLAKSSHIGVEIRAHKSPLCPYEPNFFTAKLLIFSELLFAAYDKKYLNT